MARSSIAVLLACLAGDLSGGVPPPLKKLGQSDISRHLGLLMCSAFFVL
jgi:hypothetical protein